MDAPPIQYARTSDGYDIAYSTAGTGRTLLTMPYPFSHARLSWTAPGLCETGVNLAQKFRVVHFDARGQGLSTRGLPPSHRMEDYLHDIDCVVGALRLDRFLLFGSVSFWRAAVAYAATNPHRVEALILLNPDGSLPPRPPEPWNGRSGDNWDSFLIMAGSAFSAAPLDTSGRLALRDHMKECVERDDYLKMVEATRSCDLRQWLSQINVPTLIISQRGPWNDTTVPEITAAIPGASLAVVDDYGNMLYSPTDGTPPGVVAIEDFLATAGPARPATALPAALSPRQAEVLRLIARGLTNREVAETLVLSERTVERHVADAYAKIGVDNRAQAAVYAKEHGIV
ncbi:MAG TPA: alpha/beta fold hydrolase [Dehalococcoidia bacterium]|nr:alpha/beta fold hydrolase [Dehalococcoidia bacterium]